MHRSYAGKKELAVIYIINITHLKRNGTADAAPFLL